MNIAILLPYKFAQSGSGWVSGWIFHSALLVATCLLLGFVSIILVSVFKRFPVSPPRAILYPMPFIGFALLTIDRIDMMAIPSLISWFLLLLPGPMYVHLSWAPRWRLLCMIEDGMNPFEGSPIVEVERSEDISEVAGDDSDLIEVVESFSEEE